MAITKPKKVSTGPAPAPAPARKKEAPAKRAKTPTVLQMEAAECGAAALGIILGYYKRFVPLEVLRAECGVSRDGSVAANIIKAARKFGLTAKGFRKEPSSLRKSPMPVIAHWNFNHFLVVEGFGKNKVYLNDPANGPTVVTYEEFDDQFTGVVLTFEPGPEFVKGGQKYNAIAALRSRLGNSGKALTYVILAGIGLVIPGLLVPVFSQVFVDYYLVRQLKSWLFPLIIGMVLTALLRAGLTWLREFYLLKLETKLAATMSSKFFWHVLRLPLGYFYQRFAGDIGGRVAINDQVASLISGRLASTALDILTIIFYAILMFIYDPVLTGAVILIAALNLVALRYVARKRVDVNQHFLQESGKLLGVSMSGLHIIETLKAIGRESDFFARWAGYHVKVNRANQKAGIYSQFLEAVPPLLASINVAVILTLGGLRIIQGDLTIGMLVAFQSLALSFITPINQMVELGSTLQDTEGGLKRLDDVLANPLDPVAARNEDASEISRHSPKLTGYLELRNIKFGYSRLAPPLIENFNLSLRPGSRVALVGGSGSGKSTIAKLVSGLFDPWEGEVLFDGKPRQDWSRAVVNNSLAVVDQEIFLFEGSIRENLTLWDSTISEIQYVRAAKDAHIHDEISARPEGYNSRVAEEGVNFSGGQRQRLEIARALTSDPAFLILDEATSALDPVTEKLIDENLRRRGCTCLIIAHRLSTIRDCDEIIVMEKGKIVQRGTHLEMKDVPGSPYAKLIAS